VKARGRAEALVSRYLAIGAALSLAALYAALASSEPLSAIRSFFVAPFGSAYAVLDFIESAAPLLACAVGASVAFRAGAFNLGGEGQAAAGAFAAALATAAFSGSASGPAIGPAGAGGSALNPLLVIALAVLAAAAAGAALAALSAAAEAWSGAEVLLTSFLFSQAAIIAVDWAVGGPLKDPASNLLAMKAIPLAYRFARFAPPAPLSAAAPLALGLALLAAWVQKATRTGYELKLLGRNAAFARASGIDSRLRGRALVASGALFGVGGSLVALGAAGRAFVGMTGGVGWNGLAAALVAGSDALGAIPASLFFAWLDAGARQSSMLSDLSPDSAAAIKAIALFLITARVSAARISAARIGAAPMRRGRRP